MDTKSNPPANATPPEPATPDQKAPAVPLSSAELHRLAAFFRRARRAAEAEARRPALKPGRPDDVE